jgi:hypothetical protein
MADAAPSCIGIRYFANSYAAHANSARASNRNWQKLNMDGSA